MTPAILNFTDQLFLIFILQKKIENGDYKNVDWFR